MRQLDGGEAVGRIEVILVRLVDDADEAREAATGSGSDR
jgi:hypothetical protein